MGVGTLAFYGRAGDELRFYEIDPAVAAIAESSFYFLADTQADVEVVIGDARRVLDNEAPNGFDMLFLDAFSSDSIPVHLLTQEAFEIYARHLKTDGVIAANISNAHLELEPLLRGLAQHIHMQALRIDSASDGVRGVSGSSWMLLSRIRSFLEHEAIAGAASASTERNEVLWTDDHANVLAALRILAP